MNIVIQPPGEHPAITYRESSRLTDLDGFLLILASYRCITLSKRLSETDKARAVQDLLTHLEQHADRTSGFISWYLTDERG